jgi:hypothetical protein
MRLAFLVLTWTSPVPSWLAYGLAGLVFKFNFVKGELLLLGVGWALTVAALFARGYIHGAWHAAVPFLLVGVMYVLLSLYPQSCALLFHYSPHWNYIVS